MNNQLKLLLYIAFIVAVFFYIQDSYDLFDISFIDNSKKEQKEESGDAGNIIEKDTRNYVEIYLKGGESIKVDVEVANTDALRALGLSNRKYLGDYNGMLFLFDEKVFHPFWMKDMYINLDIMFIDEQGFIVDISKNNEPCTDTYCPQIVSTAMYKYVLEVNGGFSDTNGVEVGNSLSIHLASE
jgi:hypothetical protein